MKELIGLVAGIVLALLIIGLVECEPSVYQKAKPYLSEKEIKLLEEYYDSYSGSGYDETLRAAMFVRKLRDKYEPLPEGWSYVEDQKGIFCTTYDVLVKEEDSERASVKNGDNITAKYKLYTGISVKEACGLADKDDTQEDVTVSEEETESLSNNYISPEEYDILTNTVKDCNIAKVRLINTVGSGHLTKEDKKVIDKLVLDCKRDKLLEELNN